ncbi:MAG: acetyl/propionyl/methylcrotonyl-CoA carboxylase subunit alpha [Acidimicrobiales bacterium]
MTPTSGSPATRVLVANRGEIAVRVMKTLRDLGIESVAVYSDADADARHVRAADIAVRIGPAPARESYLDVDRIVDAARATGAWGIHPGYGFLSENPVLARRCEEHGIVFIGPPAAAIEAMGDKIAAKATVAAAGVPVVPGSSGAGLDDDALAAAAMEVGLPVLIKPSAGGGGKGMRLVTAAADLVPAIEAARREARSSFGDDTLLVERFLHRPRHVEIQVLADTHGNVVHLGERECSLQRRHQKIVEEAPSPLITAEVRSAMGARAVAAARACGYVGAGTVEFIMSDEAPDEYFFMEMNTRLQVEHPVTEMIYGVDLVALQVHVAEGRPLPFDQDDLVMRGHAVEARIYAEDPANDFLPTGGVIHRVIEPGGPGVRVDSGIADGSVVGSDYDPMLAKVIAHGDDRAHALARLDAALAATAIVGVATNIGFLRRLLADDDVRAGRLDTGLVERRSADLVASDVPAAALIAAALAPLLGSAHRGDPWQATVGWRHGGPSWVPRRLEVRGHDPVEVRVRHRTGAQWDVDLGDTASGGVHLATAHQPDEHGAMRIAVDGAVAHLTVHCLDDRIWISILGSAWEIRDCDRSPESALAAAATSGPGPIRSPMPGNVIAVHVAVGEAVTAGQTVAIVEAMKMEHTLSAPTAGVVTVVHAAVGDAVALDAPVVTIGEPADGGDDGDGADPVTESKENR